MARAANVITEEEALTHNRPQMGRLTNCHVNSTIAMSAKAFSVDLLSFFSPTVNVNSGRYVLFLND